MHVGALIVNRAQTASPYRRPKPPIDNALFELHLPHTKGSARRSWATFEHVEGLLSHFPATPIP